jgi:ABC-type taurine transport system ATPase subunit
VHLRRDQWLDRGAQNGAWIVEGADLDDHRHTVDCTIDDVGRRYAQIERGRGPIPEFDPMADHVVVGQRVASVLPTLDRDRRRTRAPVEPDLRAAHERAGTLSGGEQEMLLVARSMLVSPRLILADEVTEGVQPMQISRIAEVLRACRERDGTAMLIVEQHLDFALGIADRFVLIKQGMIVDAGTSSSLGARVEIERQLAL